MAVAKGVGVPMGETKDELGVQVGVGLCTRVGSGLGVRVAVGSIRVGIGVAVAVAKTTLVTGGDGVAVGVSVARASSPPPVLPTLLRLRSMIPRKTHVASSNSPPSPALMISN